ncbi:hypothetical protein [Desulfovibrio sp. QI0442]
MSKDVIKPKAEINLLELMQHHDDIQAALRELLFPCAHCGGNAEIRSGYGGNSIYLSCPCGVSVSGGMLEILTAWNRRDGKDFDLNSEYAQRLVASESKYASFRASAFRELKVLQDRMAELERELGRKGK